MCRDSFVKVMWEKLSETNPGYKEIVLLHEKLEQDKIPHTFERWYDGWQVCYPVARSSPECICDAVEFFGSYGHENDRVELMGLITAEEVKIFGGVMGFMTAQEVFARISKHWKETQKNANA